MTVTRFRPDPTSIKLSETHIANTGLAPRPPPCTSFRAMEPLGINHVAIKALDIRLTAQFYTDVLGLTETHRNVDDRGLRSIWLRCGTVVLMIERSAAPAQRSTGFDHDPPGLHLLALAIEPSSRVAWVAKIEAMGYPIVLETEYTVYVQDPEGNRIGLSTWPHRSRPG